MKKNRILILGILVLAVIVILVSSTFIFLYSDEKKTDNGNIGDNIEDNNSKILNSNNNNLNYEEKIIGNTSYGTVSKSGPYGNPNSRVKIAYILGVHPQEANTHNIFFEIFKSKSNLNYGYYIYRINVTQDITNYEKERMNGQLLANKYVVEDIVKNDFDLAIDIHSNVGNWDENQFLFAPSEKGKSKDLALKITEKIPWLSYYTPPNPTSPTYLTIPLIERGVPAIIFEEFFKTPANEMKRNIDEFIYVVDNLAIK